MTKLDLAHLNRQKATVVQGAKAAKGLDDIKSSVMEFSSLMSVMNDDFALMKTMEKEYVSEKSEVSVPEEIRQSDFELEAEPSNSLDIEDVDLEMLDVLSHFTEREEPQKDMVTDFALHSLPDVFVDPTINSYSLEEIEYQPLDDDLSLDELATIPTQVLNSMPVMTDVIVQVEALEPVQVEVPDVERAKFKIVDEVLKVIEQPEDFKMEVVVEDEVEQEDFGLKELFKREVFFEELALDEDVSLDEAVLGMPVVKREFTSGQEEQKKDSDTENILSNGLENQNAFLLGANAVTVSTIASTSGKPVVTSTADVNFSNVLERREKEDLPKMLKAPKQQTHFAQLLDEASDEALEKMSFNNKLLRKLELIINDPLGRMDVEIAQDAGGVHVKAVVPIEVLKSMDGLQQELQSALLQQGLELGSFEMEERGDRVNNRIGNSEINSDITSSEGEKLEEIMLGGILVNQRV